MIAVDTNILVYAHRRDSTFHADAKRAIESLVVAGAPWAISWATVHEFLSICSNPRIYKPASPMPLALEQLAQWFEGGAIVLGETPDHFTTGCSAKATSLVAGSTTPGSPQSASTTALPNSGQPTAISRASTN